MCKYNPHENYCFTIEEFNKAKSRDKLPVRCLQCNEIFFATKKDIQTQIKTKQNSIRFCSLLCNGKSIRNGIKAYCIMCGKEQIRTPSRIKQSGNIFCSHKCAITYRNLHKTNGYRRSKLEFFLEENLPKLFPDLKLVFNDRKVCDGIELDIYIPSLNIAFELNGPIHYQPVFGKTKDEKTKRFETVKNRDLQKQIICQEKGIELYIVDVSKYKRATKEGDDYYLELVKDCIIESM